MDYISLFAGVGGFDLAFNQSGMNCIGYAEIDKFASKVMEHRFPDAKNYGDVRNVTKESVGQSVDLVCGGFPCTDLSVAGKRAGLAGERSGLWYEFHRIIAELNPVWVEIENVPGLLSSNGGRDMGIILGALAELGYGYAYRVLDAQYFGVAQRRRRVFIVANSRNWTYPAKVLFEPESSPWDSPPSRETGQDPAGCLTARAGKDGADANGQIDKLTVAMAINSRNNRYDAESQTSIPFSTHSHYDYKESEQAATLQGRQNRQRGDTNLVAFHNRQDPDPSGEITHPLGAKDNGMGIAWEMSHPDDPVRESGDVAPTLQHRMGTGDNQVPLIGVRRLTPLECERLQGFPDEWTNVDEMSDTQRYKQMGNAVCVPVVRWIADRIIKVERGKL